MPNKTPIAANVVSMLSDAVMRLRIVFMEDGRICPETEAPVLRLVTDALNEAQSADDARIEAIYALNFGLEEPPTKWHARKRREHDRTAEFNDIA